MPFETDDTPMQAAINATGVILHPNLGRAPMSAAARAAMIEAAGYATLEIDPASGRHRPRVTTPGALAARLCGTDAATVVNNGAAALVLALHALCPDREVVVSRGELVEIGRTYRLPEMIGATPARLVEVGTTNRTRLRDYREAVTAATGALLKVHPPTQHLTGSTVATTLEELATLAQQTGVPLIHHLGSGLPRGIGGPLAHEPTIADSVAQGADLVLVSGDKLLGGPQAGIIAGRADLVRRCEQHPLARALRIDKAQRAALEATLLAWLRTQRPVDLPVVAMLEADPLTLHQRSVWMAQQLGGGTDAVRTTGRVGGSLLPGIELPSWALRVPTSDARSTSARLLAGDPPVVAGTDDDAVLLDVRTVPPDRDAEVVDLVRRACSPPTSR